MERSGFNNLATPTHWCVCVCVCVQVYKLRAADAKERQYWVSRLRNEIERCTSAHAGFRKTQV